MACNFVIMILTVVFADFISGNSSKVYAISGILLSFAGSFFCDMDRMSFGRAGQRNPVTHSYVVPFLIWWYAFLVLSVSAGENFLIILPAMFCLGAGSHLLLDTVPTNAGFIRQFEEFFNFKQSPIGHAPRAANVAACDGFPFGHNITRVLWFEHPPVLWNRWFHLGIVFRLVKLGVLPPFSDPHCRCNRNRRLRRNLYLGLDH